MLCHGVSWGLEGLRAGVQPSSALQHGSGAIYGSKILLFFKHTHIVLINSDMINVCFNHPLKICWLCLATKGAHDLGMVFTDSREDAPWRASFLQSNPWQVTPAYSQLFGFQIRMVRPDLLHIWNLGVSRDVIGCTLKVLLKERRVWQASNLNDRMEAATADLRSFARSNGHVLRLKRLTKKKISWSNKTYPEFRGSGSDAHIVGTWLEHVLGPFGNMYGDLCTLLWTSNRAMRVLYNADRFLSGDEKNTVQVLGQVFSQTYLRLALQAISSNQLMFRVRPKFHILMHVTDCYDCLNASVYATWMDEDWLKKIARTMQLTSSKTAQFRVMERWLLAVPFNLKKISNTAG